MKRRRTDAQLVGVVGGLVLAEAGSGWNLIQAELSDVFVSAEFQHILSLLSSAVRKRVCFLSACLSITQFIFTPSPNPLPNLPQNEGHFSFSAPFITPRRESVSKSVYMTDTGSETLDFFRRPTKSDEICGDAKKKIHLSHLHQLWRYNRPTK